MTRGAIHSAYASQVANAGLTRDRNQEQVAGKLDELALRDERARLQLQRDDQPFEGKIGKVGLRRRSFRHSIVQIDISHGGMSQIEWQAG